MRQFIASLFVGLALMVGGATASQAQVVVVGPRVGVEIGGPPVCEYGYYEYAPYACAPEGYYGSGYFYNGIFLGVGPWYHWGYGHGWGYNRFHVPTVAVTASTVAVTVVTHQGYRGSYRGNGGYRSGGYAHGGGHGGGRR
jgi:hypothetical protein